MLDAKMPTNQGMGLLYENICEIEQTALPSRVNELLREGWVLLGLAQMTSAVPMHQAKASETKAIGEPGMYVKRFWGFVVGRPRA